MRILLPLLALCLWPLRAAEAQFHQNPPEPLPAWAVPLDNSLLMEDQKGEWLVEAQCVAFDKSRPSLPLSIVAITHNFTGPDGIVGQSFTPSVPFNTGAPAFPLMPLGSKGLFVIHWFPGRRDERGSWSNMGRGYSYNFPALEKYELRGSLDIPRYKPALAQARAIEAVARAQREKQIALLRSYARSAIAERSAWGIDTLAHSGLDGVPQFLLGLAGTDLPVAGQMVLDRDLLALDNQKKVHWANTPARFALFQHLVTAPMTTQEGSIITSRFDTILREEVEPREKYDESALLGTPPIEGTRLFEWLRSAVANPRWADFSRQNVLVQIGTLGSLGKIPRAMTWTHLLQRLLMHPDFASPTNTTARTDPSDKSLSETAAIVIGYLRPFTPEETATLHALQLRSQSSQLKDWLTQTLAPKPPNN